MPGGGLNSRISIWQTAVFNATRYSRTTSADHDGPAQRPRGRVTGPVQVDDPWGAFADDQIGLMDHLGINEFLALGCCIGGPFALKLMQRVPDRVQAVVMCQPVGHRADLPDAMYDAGHNTWGPALRPPPRPEHGAHRQVPAQPLPQQDDFVYSVSRDFVRSCQTPILVMPDNTPAHSYQVAIEVTKLAPKVEVTLYPWKETPETKARTVERVRTSSRRINR